MAAEVTASASAAASWLLALLAAFGLGPLGFGLWLSNSVLAVIPRKRWRCVIGGLVLALLLASGWIPGWRLHRRLAEDPDRRVSAEELLILAYLNAGAVTGVSIVAFGRRRAPRPIPPTRESDPGFAPELLALHRARFRWSPFSYLPGNEVYRVRVRDWEVPASPASPAAAARSSELDGFTILHLSDLHLGPYQVREYFERVRDAAWRLDHDIVVFTGDFLSRTARPEDLGRWLDAVRGGKPCFGILGNHDLIDHPVDELRRVLIEGGVTLLGGGTRLVRRGSSGNGPAVGLAGLDYQNWWRSAPLRSLRAAIPDGAFPVLVAHNPCVFPQARKAGFRLVLCGHTHGGQVRVPGLGAVFIPARYGRRYQMGLYREGESFLHVHPGLGGSPPWRLGARPEITRIILRATAK